jgi:hypothetical protein
MKNKKAGRQFETVVNALIGGGESIFPTAVHISKQFRPEDEDNHSISRNLNAAFMIILAGEAHPLYTKASGYLDTLQSHPGWENVVRFYREGIHRICTEIPEACIREHGFERDLSNLYSLITNPRGKKEHLDTTDALYRVFFPEGVSLSDVQGRSGKITLLRKKRRIDITRLNEAPVADPVREILFTSNILITTPLPLKNVDELSLSAHLKRMVRQIMEEEQIFWYDHPIPVGVSTDQNEILYGLKGLDRAVAFEKARGSINRDARLTCALSVSVTHEGLQKIVKEYIEDELRNEGCIRNLNLYVFTEADSMRIVREVLTPAAERYTGFKVHSLLYRVFGVDGEYGRHYSFLKAIAALWQVFIDPDVRATFKIDLDQVFPQKDIVEQSGFSVFEHFKTPLWGAEGIDSQGNRVELGMIAGALVNEKDIEHSLFYPDVRFPEREAKGDEQVFFSTLPQALSTEAEMMTRYTEGETDGVNHCIQRIHVTGGTNGIMINALRRHRPFTPTFIGRAEDQAYILSILFQDRGKRLRYVHKDGLIMRHDKEGFAGEAIQTAATGKRIGDYIRILMFSYYARTLPWSIDELKDTIDPFTGCFVSRIPLTVVYLRFALKAATFFDDDTEELNQQGFEFLHTGSRRLLETIIKLTARPNPLIRLFRDEQTGWNAYYEVLDLVEEQAKHGDTFAIELKKKAEELVRGCRINF